jgi:hypothetical protein
MFQSASRERHSKRQDSLDSPTPWVLFMHAHSNLTCFECIILPLVVALYEKLPCYWRPGILDGTKRYPKPTWSTLGKGWQPEASSNVQGRSLIKRNDEQNFILRSTSRFFQQQIFNCSSALLPFDTHARFTNVLVCNKLLSKLFPCTIPNTVFFLWWSGTE